MDFFKNFDSDDDIEFISTFFNVVQHIHNEESSNVARSSAVVNRDRQAAHDLLVCDYFADNYLYNDDSFERHFRINNAIFLRISNALEARYGFFKQKPDARGIMSFSSIQKCEATLRYLGYGITFDASDEYLKVSEMTAIDCVDWFCACVYDVFHQQYLRSNNSINVLGKSPLFNNIWTDEAPDMSFTVNGYSYKYGYYLDDVIYPNYSTLMNAYLVSRSEKTKLFTKRQEPARKNIDRTF
ncbi:uncharacterized protein LOC111913604 [Lactuca sativa]|uniref:uncharacterized protein LOC111913604 n=1 Tax=Lactuca sativa TaxID=4236 RepID=UPI000CD9A3DA|nr:uncharacterized protein LOC111913604 [Lactuca sativa]